MFQPVGTSGWDRPGAHLPVRVLMAGRLGFQVMECQGNFEPRECP